MVIYLIGPRACGKSTLAVALAQALDCPFVDTDGLVVDDAGCSIADIVAREGWEGFRQRESAALHHAAAMAKARVAQAQGQHHYIIATGGGMVEREDNRRFMRQTGLVLRLLAPAALLAARMLADEAKAHTSGGTAPLRPALLQDKARDPQAEMEEILRRREPLYACAAHHALDAERPLAELCAEVVGLVVGKGQL